jgi:hypothetical protein
VKTLAASLISPLLPALASGVRERSQWVFAACAAALVALVVAFFYLWNLYRQARSANPAASAKDLFAELCEVHELNRLERTLIQQLAATYELPQPAAIFVDPWPLEQASAASSPDAHRYRSLRQKLFGSLD